MRRLSHTRARPVRAVPLGVGALIGHCERALKKAGVCFGHGTDNARDEAAELVFFAAGLDHAAGAAAYTAEVGPRTAARIARLLQQRIRLRVPLPYLTHRAFFAGLELYVDRRVLVPRSPIAELVAKQFVPWIAPGRTRRILDVGTGCGAIAVACAAAFRAAKVDAVDISPAALQVCRRNVRRLRMASRVNVLRSDYFSGVPRRRYDIIVSNPPYVGRAEMRTLPPEYRREPRLGLASGDDGLDAVRAIFAAAPRHLRSGGILVVEVGNTERALLRAYPHLPFIWPDISIGGGGVFVLRAQDLQVARM